MNKPARSSSSAGRHHHIGCKLRRLHLLCTRRYRSRCSSKSNRPRRSDWPNSRAAPGRHTRRRRRCPGCSRGKNPSKRCWCSRGGPRARRPDRRRPRKEQSHRCWCFHRLCRSSRRGHQSPFPLFQPRRSRRDRLRHFRLARPRRCGCWHRLRSPREHKPPERRDRSTRHGQASLPAPSSRPCSRKDCDSRREHPVDGAQKVVKVDRLAEPQPDVRGACPL
jgi:hypothetical protein